MRMEDMRVIVTSLELSQYMIHNTNKSKTLAPEGQGSNLHLCLLLCVWATYLTSLCLNVLMRLTGLYLPNWVVERISRTCKARRRGPGAKQAPVHSYVSISKQPFKEIV